QLEVPGQSDRLGAQRVDSRSIEQLERGQQRRCGEDSGIRDLPAFCAGERHELVRHGKTTAFVVAPPAREAGQVEGPGVPLVYEASADRAGAAIQVLVAAPYGKIDVPIVQVQRYVADCVSQIEPDDACMFARRRGDALHVEALARQILHARQQHERDLLRVTGDQLANVVRMERALRTRRLDFD